MLSLSMPHYLAFPRVVTYNAACFKSYSPLALPFCCADHATNNYFCPSPIRVVTYNVRMDTEADADDRWDCRKEVVANIFKEYKPAVFGLQVSHSSDQPWAGL